MPVEHIDKFILLIYNLFVALSLVHLLMRYRRNEILVFIVLLFWIGLFTDLGKGIQNFYKIFVLGYSVYIISRYKVIEEIRKIRGIWLSFILFAAFVVTINIFIIGDSAITIFSQMYKYMVPIILLPLLARVCRNELNVSVLNRVFGEILLIQIFLSLLKLVLLGTWAEGLVGSLSGLKGGGAATTIPLLGLCWFALRTKMEIKNVKSILFLLGLLFLGYMAGKRAVWVLFPILFVLVSVLWSNRKVLLKHITIILILLPIVLYAGLRLSPTFNPEKKIGGSFDPVYAWNYTMDYSMGKEDASGDKELGQGRIGAIQVVLHNIFNYQQSDIEKLLIGYGVEYIFNADYDNYHDEDYYFGINHKGSFTGFVKFFFAYGFIGVILFFAFLLNIMTIAKYGKYKYLLGGVLLFDFVFYNATILDFPALMTFMIFLMLYSNKVYENEDNLTKFKVYKNIDQANTN